MDSSANVEKFPFEYKVEVPANRGSSNLDIEIPWLDEDRDLIDQMERDVIYADDELHVIEQRYENGFHIIFIQTAEKIILKSNWELDDMGNGSFLPRIQQN